MNLICNTSDIWNFSTFLCFHGSIDAQPSIIFTICMLLIVHFFGDWFLQFPVILENKFVSQKYLLMHCVLYSILFAIFSIKFAVITFVLHYIVDYIGGKLAQPISRTDSVWIIFVGIGLDQLIHTIALIVLYNYLFLM